MPMCTFRSGSVMCDSICLVVSSITFDFDVLKASLFDSYHSIYQMHAIEMIHKRVLRSIYPGLHYDDILELVSLQSLKKRRDDILCKAYFNRLKCNTHRLHHLIPERRDVHYRLRNANVYPIPVTRTDRYNFIVPWGLCNWQ